MFCGQTDGWTDSVIPIYPPKLSFVCVWGGVVYKIKSIFESYAKKIHRREQQQVKQLFARFTS